MSSEISVNLIYSEEIDFLQFMTFNGTVNFNSVFYLFLFYE